MAGAGVCADLSYAEASMPLEKTAGISVDDSLCHRVTVAVGLEDAQPRPVDAAKPAAAKGPCILDVMTGGTGVPGMKAELAG
jgi:hypothetical protein